MVLGYFIYEYILFGLGTALPSKPSNLLQGGVSAVAAVPIVLALKKMNFSLNN
jgi:amino acid permease